MQGREGCPQNWPVGVYIKLHACYRTRRNQRLTNLGLQNPFHGGDVNQVALSVDAEAASRLKWLLVER
jgi:hypothetical protein